MTGPLLDVSRARISPTRGGVLVDDPASPWLVRVWVTTPDAGRPVVRRLQVDARDPAVGITSSRLAHLPMAQLRHLAAVEAGRGAADHPDEIYYRMLARPRPPGGWGDDHWRAVLAVYSWAEETGRPGGGAWAVADLWGVTVRPTVERWLAEARRRERRGLL
jgi:hypothetical protein